MHMRESADLPGGTGRLLSLYARESLLTFLEGLGCRLAPTPMCLRTHTHTHTHTHVHRLTRAYMHAHLLSGSPQPGRGPLAPQPTEQPVVAFRSLLLQAP